MVLLREEGVGDRSFLRRVEFLKLGFDDGRRKLAFYRTVRSFFFYLSFSNINECR